MGYEWYMEDLKRNARPLFISTSLGGYSNSRTQFGIFDWISRRYFWIHLTEAVSRGYSGYIHSQKLASTSTFVEKDAALYSQRTNPER